MAEATVHTFDLSAKVCYCGHIHAAPTHTITTLVQPLAWWRERPMPGTPLPPLRFIPRCSAPRVPHLSPEWADRLWALAEQSEQPTLEPSQRIRIHVVDEMPPGWFQPISGPPCDRVFTRADLTARRNRGLVAPR